MMNDKLDDAFDELEFDVSETYRKQNYIEQQKAVATGVTDGSTLSGNSDYTFKDMLLDRIKDLEALVAKLDQRIKVLESK
jgi:hypothetical protein